MKNISYIIPHYNSFESIKKLIDSIDIKDGDEILVIDDCSTDGSYELLSKLQVDIILLQNSCNGGAGKARNLGIKKAKNQWIIFADSDDYFIDGYRTILNEYLDSTNDIIYFSPKSETISHNRSVVGNRHGMYSYLIDEYLKNPSVNNLNNLKFKMVVPWSKMVNKCFIESNGIGFDEVDVSNDVMFATKIGLNAKKITVSNKSIYCCIESDKSMTADTTFDKTYKRLNIFSNQYSYLKKNLDNKELKEMTITGFSYLLLSLKSGYSFTQFSKIFNFMKENDIPLFTLDYFVKRIRRALKI